MAQPRILSVGQCGFDHGQLTRAIGNFFDATVTGAETFEAALAELRAHPFDLVLVNRVTDADSSQGIDLIRTLKADPELAAVPVMLVSDLASAQAEAVALGALPGFGKKELRKNDPVPALDKLFPATA